MITRIDNYFRDDNTDGYTEVQLDELNRRLVAEHGSEYSDDPDFDEIQAASERIATAFDTEIAAG